MNLRDFRNAGHAPTLLSAFLYFDVSFMIWVLIGSLANSIAPAFRLGDFQKGLLVAVPILGGAILRLVLGPLADHLGARRTALIGMLLTIAPLVLGWTWADSFPKLLLVGVMLGVAGASFAVALPLASRWYPPQYQGLAMGIAGAGNSGTALATFFGPRLAQAWGWHAVFGLALVPLIVVFVVFLICAKDSPLQPAPQPFSSYFTALRNRDAWWFCFFYSITFGGFVGLANFLNIFFATQYGLSRIQAGNFATLCVVAGSFLRPLGGYFADRVGGIKMLTLFYLGIAATMLGMTAQPPLGVATVLLFTTMGLLGMGNGAVFQIVPQRFSREIGVVTGLVGAAGGMGGFLLPTLLGGVRQWTGSFSGGFLFFAIGGGLGGAIALSIAARSWEGVFVGRGGLATLEPIDEVIGISLEADALA